MRRSALAGAAVLACMTSLVHAQEAAPPTTPWPQFLGFRANIVGQHLFPMRSPYEGPNSLPGNGATATSESYAASFGAQLTPRLQALGDVRWQRGAAIAGGNGLAGVPNADFVPGATPGPPYFNHAYLRYEIPLGSRTTHRDKAFGQLAHDEPDDRVVVKIGRIEPNDDFDKNRYMDSAVTQFLNLGLVNNPAWDFAQNNLGVTQGIAVGILHPHWILHVGTFQMPTAAGGRTLTQSLRPRNDNAELVLRGNDDGPVLRLLAYQNHGDMGDYREALALAAAAGTAPDLAPTRRPGHRKRGAGASFEWPLADKGETGVFGCLGWNDGRTEDFSYTEADHDACAGVQVSGRHWGRGEDRIAAALVVSGLSPAHREYLAAGGIGIQLGDGALRYGTERIVEVYYRFQVNKALAISPDLQLVQNPGFNRDRGPAALLGARVTASF